MIGLPTPHLWALFAFILKLGPITGLAFPPSSAWWCSTRWGMPFSHRSHEILISTETQVMILLILAFWAWCCGITGIVVAVPIFVTFRVLFAHVEALALFGEFLAQKHAPENAPGA